MREPPANLADDTLRTCLRDRYGLAIVELAFLPLGHDASAWVYRARAADGTYFLKARLGGVTEAGLAAHAISATGGSRGSSRRSRP